MTAPAALPPVGRQRPSAALSEALASVAARFQATLAETSTDVELQVAAEHVAALFPALRDDPALAFDFLRNISGIDYGDEGRALKYQLYSFRHGHALQVAVALPVYTFPHVSVASIEAIYPGANWHEREAAEMFGIDFAGHPNLLNLLLEEDLHIHPLLKVHPLQKMEVKQGIESGPAGFNI